VTLLTTVEAGSVVGRLGGAIASDVTLLLAAINMLVKFISKFSEGSTY
jgi:hypothetical protein